MSDAQDNWIAEAKKLYSEQVEALQVQQRDLPKLPEEHLSKLAAATEASPVVTCKGHAIPSGFVIIGETTNFACSSSFNNAWIIKRPNQQEIVCKVSPIPASYVIVGETTNFGCSSAFNNAWIIKVPGAQEVVCKQSPIPDGYIIKAQTTNFACSNVFNNAWIIARV